MKSNTYNRKDVKPQSHSLYDIIAANIALKIKRKHRIGIADAMRCGYFLGFFVLLYSAPYSWYKRKRLMAKINKKERSNT